MRVFSSEDRAGVDSYFSGVEQMSGLAQIALDISFPSTSHVITMIRNPRTKRFLSVTLLILGGVLMFLAPENIWIGALLFALGIGVEIVGLVLGHRK